MDPSSASTTNSATNSPQTAPKQEEETLTRGNWRSEEENALVAAVNEVGEGNWANVQTKLVEKGFAKRGLEGVHQHYNVLSARAQAKGVPLTGALPLDPWTDEEGALLLAINRLVQEEATARNLPYVPAVAWSRFLSFFPGRSSTDLASYYGSIRKSEKRGSQAKRFERVKAKKDEAYETIKQGFAKGKSSRTLSTSSAATTGASPTAQIGQSSQNATSENVQSTFSSAAQPDSSSFPSPAQNAAPPFPAQPPPSTLTAPSSTFILPRLVVTAATQTDFPPSPSPTSVSAQAFLPAGNWSDFDFNNKGVQSAGMKRVRAVFDEGRRVFKRIREVFEQTEGSDEED